MIYYSECYVFIVVVTHKILLPFTGTLNTLVKCYIVYIFYLFIQGKSQNTTSNHLGSWKLLVPQTWFFHGNTILI